MYLLSLSPRKSSSCYTAHTVHTWHTQRERKFPSQHATKLSLLWRPERSTVHTHVCRVGRRVTRMMTLALSFHVCPSIYLGEPVVPALIGKNLDCTIWCYVCSLQHWANTNWTLWAKKVWSMFLFFFFWEVDALWLLCSFYSSLKEKNKNIYCP